MVGMLAIAAAVGWLLAFSLCAVATRIPRRWAGATAPWPGPAGERPALVNLVATRGRLSGAAYPATVLDLAAKGHLMITRRAPGQLWCDVPAAAPADTGLAQSERLALTDARRLADRGGAPFEAVAESCASDVRGKWDPFEQAVRAEGRQAGLTRPRLPVAVQAPLYVGAGVVSLLVFPAVDAVPHTSGVVAPLVAAFFAFVIPVTVVGSLSQQDRPTGHGAAVAAWAAREGADAAASRRHLGPVPVSSPADLSALALAVATGAPVPVPGVSPGLAAGVRPGRATARSAQSAQTPVEATGFQLGMLGAIYRGAELTVSLTVAQGAMGHLSSGPARRWGRPLHGIGDEAWLINGHHTVVFRLGSYTGKITISGSASCSVPPDVLPRLATAVAGRLAAADTSPLAAADTGPLAAADTGRLAAADWPAAVDTDWPPSGIPSPGTSG